VLKSGWFPMIVSGITLSLFEVLWLVVADPVVLAPVRRCAASGWQPSESLPCLGSADYCSCGVC